MRLERDATEANADATLHTKTIRKRIIRNSRAVRALFIDERVTDAEGLKRSFSGFWGMRDCFFAAVRVVKQDFCAEKRSILRKQLYFSYQSNFILL